MGTITRPIAPGGNEVRRKLKSRRPLSGAKRRSLESRSHRKNLARERRQVRRQRRTQEYQALLRLARRIAIYFAAADPEAVLERFPEIRMLLPLLTSGNNRQVHSGVDYLGRLLEEELGRWMPHHQRAVVLGLPNWFEIECHYQASMIKDAVNSGFAFQPSKEKEKVFLRSDVREQLRADALARDPGKQKAVEAIVMRWDPWEVSVRSHARHPYKSMLPELVWGLQHVCSEQDAMTLVSRVFPNVVAWTVDEYQRRLEGLARELYANSKSLVRA